MQSDFKLAIVGEAKQIILSQGLFALVDEQDYARVIKRNWYTHRTNWSDYARSDTPERNTYLHTFIMQPPPGFTVHHVDDNGLNCTRLNMEICTQSINAAHKRLVSRGTSKFRGVYRHQGRWAAEITVQYKKIFLGSYDLATEAALAYNAGVLKYRGEGFPLNVVAP